MSLYGFSVHFSVVSSFRIPIHNGLGVFGSHILCIHNTLEATETHPLFFFVFFFLYVVHFFMERLGKIFTTPPPTDFLINGKLGRREYYIFKFIFLGNWFDCLYLLKDTLINITCLHVTSAFLNFWVQKLLEQIFPGRESVVESWRVLVSPCALCSPISNAKKPKVLGNPIQGCKQCQEGGKTSVLRLTGLAHGGGVLDMKVACTRHCGRGEWEVCYYVIMLFGCVLWHGVKSTLATQACFRG